MSHVQTGDLSALRASHKGDAQTKRHNAVIRVTAYATASVIAVLMLTAALPPIVADESDRAILDARVTLLTTPIAGEVTTLRAAVGQQTGAGDLLAEVKNARVDETTLMALSEKVQELQEKVTTATNKKASDLAYLAVLDKELFAEKTALIAQFGHQVAALQAKVGAAQADVATKATLHDRQVQLLAHDVVSRDMLKPGFHELESAGSLRVSADALLAAARAQLAAIQRDIYVGDNLIGIATLAQKRRDVSFDAERQAIEERAATTAFHEMSRLRDLEQARVNSMKGTLLAAPPAREVLQVGVAPGRHVNAGDSLATLVDCKSLFAVAIFSYRQAANLSVGTRMSISGPGITGTIGGVVSDIIPKSSDKTDELYAVSFPQTERREMYVVVTPDDDDALRTRNEEGQSQGVCPVGKWVTVSRADGWIPSSSVLWQGLSRLASQSVAALWPTQPAQARPKLRAQ